MVLCSIWVLYFIEYQLGADLKAMNKYFDRLMQFEWMGYTIPDITSCQCIHPGISCSEAIIKKILKVMKVGFRFYLIVHLIPFLINVKKMLRQKTFKESCLKRIKKFIGSVLFMVHLVNGLKLSLCSGYLIPPYRYDGTFFSASAVVSSTCILWEDSAKRQQISFFIFIRALRSLYIYSKKRRWVSIANEAQVSFVLIFGLLSWIFYEYPLYLKHTNILEAIWGEA